MRRGLLGVLCAVASWVCAQEVPPGLLLPAAVPPPAPNPVADPFAAHSLPALPPVPQGKPLALPSALPLPAPLPPLPAGLRVAMTRDHGQALLSTGEMGASSILVSHGKNAWIAGQSYFAEVDARSVRLYQGARGKLLWEGGLGGTALAMVPPDLTQARFIPPLSAGSNPGLRAQGSTGGVMPNTAASINTAQNAAASTGMTQPAGVR